MKGIIDVGGGLRGVYGAGVFDYCLDNGISFDYCIGVSAGSANAATFLASQRGRTLQFYSEYSARKEYMSLHNLIQNGSYIDLDYIYGALSNSDGENPLDFDAIMKNKTAFKVVATDADTGEAVYFDKKDFVKDDYFVLKASCSIPCVCKPYRVNSKSYFDGGVADPVPLKKAYADGCDFAAVILTRPVDYLKNPRRDILGARLIEKKYPSIADGIFKRSDKYNCGVEFAKKMQKKDKAIIIAPDDCCGVDTLTRDSASIKRLYDKGYEDGKKLNFLMHSA